MKTLIAITFVMLMMCIIAFRDNKNIYVEAMLDGKEYYVRNSKDKQKAAELLATIKKNIYKFCIHLDNFKSSKYKAYIPYIKQLNQKIKRSEIYESEENSIYTSYSVNKGEYIVFCLRSRKNKSDFHNLNLLMYVVLHELAHVACPDYGHNELFKQIFAFFVTVAIQNGFYKKIDFAIKPQEYCGLVITDSII